MRVLERALAALAGTTGQLAANTTFAGNFKAAKSGTASDLITVQGPRAAVLKASAGRALELTGSYRPLRNKALNNKIGPNVRAK